jgi:hypothetical protein
LRGRHDERQQAKSQTKDRHITNSEWSMTAEDAMHSGVALVQESSTLPEFYGGVRHMSTALSRAT